MTQRHVLQHILGDSKSYTKQVCEEKAEQIQTIINEFMDNEQIQLNHNMNIPFNSMMNMIRKITREIDSKDGKAIFARFLFEILDWYDYNPSYMKGIITALSRDCGFKEKQVTHKFELLHVGDFDVKSFDYIRLVDAIIIASNPIEKRFCAGYSGELGYTRCLIAKFKGKAPDIVSKLPQIAKLKIFTAPTLKLLIREGRKTGNWQTAIKRSKPEIYDDIFEIQEERK